jgi:hypothetical protein
MIAPQRFVRGALGGALIWAITASLIVIPTSASSTADLVIYDNAIASDWKDGSYGLTSQNLCDGTHVVSPSCAESVTISADSALGYTLNSGTISTAGYQALDWYVYLSGSSIDNFKTYLEDSSGNHIKGVALSSVYVVGSSNGFTHVSVPIKTLNPNNVPVHEFRLMKNASTSSATPNSGSMRPALAARWLSARLTLVNM